MSKRSNERIEFLADIITTAIEGGVGYWAYTSQYQYTYNGELVPCIGKLVADKRAHAILHEMADSPKDGEVFGDDFDGYYFKKKLLLSIDTVAKGLAAIKRGDEKCRTAYDKEILVADRDNDAGMIDSSAADCIVQAGLFGKVVYG